MKSRTLLVTVLLTVCSTLNAQEQRYEPVLIKEFPNIKSPGDLFYPATKSSDIDKYGNDIVFDLSGNPIVLQWEQGLVYFMNRESWHTDQIVKPALPLNLRVAEDLSFSDGKIILFHNLYGPQSAIDTTGKALFRVNLDWLKTTITSSFYYADVLFFTDGQYRLQSIVSPSTDQKKNQMNYRNVEQTRALFQPNAARNLMGLTMDEKGAIFLQGAFRSNGKAFYAMIGNFLYNPMHDFVYVADAKKLLVDPIPIPQIEGSTIECVSVHPSGDIYFLVYTKSRNVHSLFRIENTWDAETRQVWIRGH